MAFVRAELARRPRLRVLDVGCGAARNAAPMAAQGATVVGTDLAWPMLEAAGRRVVSEGVAERVALVRAPMDRLPLRDASIDLVVAHGIWNLARSAAELRRAIAEAARVARPGAGLFVFTFSRATLAPPPSPPAAGRALFLPPLRGPPQRLPDGGGVVGRCGGGGGGAPRGRPRGTTARSPAAHSRGVAL